jgi:hypothetical protein
MKANWKVIGIVSASAALLVYPSMKLYQFLAKKLAKGEGNETGGKKKPFLHTLRGKRNPLNRQPHNGHHAQPGLAQ